MLKERFNFWITKKNKERLEKATDFKNNSRARRKKYSMGELLNALIEQKMADPIQVLKERRQEHIDKVHMINTKIKELEKIRDDEE